jgi:hypothetical protein
MPKRRTAKPKKRDPKEDPPAYERLLKLTQALKAQFDAAHADGMRALKRRDFEGLSRVIERERHIIQRQRDRLATQRKKAT